MTNDLISRQKVIDMLAEMQGRCTSKAALIHNSKIWQQIKDLPSAQPKPGKWKFTKYYFWECSQCKKNPTKGFGYVQGKDELFDFCPNCGARMKGEEYE